MSRNALRALHAAASTLGLLLILSFFTSTIVVGVVGDSHAIAAVKSGIVHALFALVPVMAVAGLSGQRLAGRSRAPVVLRKLRRTRWVGINAMLVLIPCALALAWLASRGSFGWTFAALQAAELVAGAANIVLLGLNLRDGLAMRAARVQGGSGRRAGTRPRPIVASLPRTP
jgi:hypothetical protein